MTVRTAERRCGARAATAYSVVVRSRKGRVLARGRTANISENGVFVLARLREESLRDGQVILDLAIPATAAARGKKKATRTVTFLCRIARTTPVGQLLGIGVEFIEKLA